MACGEPTTTPTADTAPTVPIIDKDGDGVAVEDDCDDDAPDVWSNQSFKGVLSDPAEIATFCDGYCRRNIQGDLVVREGAVTEGMECVRRVTGDLVVAGDALDVSGLSEIAVVGGSVRVEFLRELDRLVGLQFTKVGGDVIIQDNLTLTRVGMFRHLQTIDGDLVIQRNDNLDTLAGRELDSVGGDLIMRDNLRLIDVTSLDDVTSVGGGVTVLENASLEPLLSFGRLTEVGGPIALDNNLGVTAFSRLAAAPEVRLVGADDTRVVEGFGSLRSIEGDLVISYGVNTGITLVGFGALQTIGGDFVLDDVNVMSAHFLGGLSNLRQISGDVRLRSEGLLDVTFFSLLEGAGGIDISQCKRLKSVTGFGQLTTVAGDVTITRNEQLESIAGFGALERIGGELRIASNPLLDSVAGLRRLEAVGGDLELNSNWHQLSSLQGLEGVRTIGGDLAIQYNYELADVSALSGVEQVGGNVCFYANPRLSQFEAFSMINEIDKIGGNIDYELQAGLCDI